MLKSLSIFNFNTPLRVVLRVILFLLFMEGFLDAGGWVFMTVQEFRNQMFAHKGAYRILCLGDSITANGGVYSYPSQLQAALMQEFPRSKFQVINKGTPSWTTSEMSQHFDSYLQHYQPDMIIFMVGVNDVYFYHMGPVNFQQKIKFLILDRIKVYRLIKELCKRKQVGSASDSQDSGPDKALVGLEKSTPLADIKMQDNAVTYEVNAPQYYKDITHYHPLTIRNYNEMIESALNKGITVVAMQYPMMKVDSLKQIIYSKDKVIFIDNENNFRAVVQQQGYYQYFNDGTGHLTPQGAKLLVNDLIRGLKTNFDRGFQ